MSKADSKSKTRAINKLLTIASKIYIAGDNVREIGADISKLNKASDAIHNLINEIENGQ